MKTPTGNRNRGWTQTNALEEELRGAGVDWQLIQYGGAVHSFTDWNAGRLKPSGAAYDERADRRSWEHLKLFFAEIFK